MAERRMFTQKITDSDAFIDMPLSTQCLYFHLCMNADDDGFVNNPKRIQKMLGASEDDVKLLIAKSFILPFESGVIVIKHWRMHNLLRKDRYKETRYLEEKSTLFLKENGAYTFDKTQGKKIPKMGSKKSKNPTDNQMATNGIPNDNQVAPQYSQGQNSLDKDNMYNNHHLLTPSSFSTDDEIDEEDDNKFYELNSSNDKLNYFYELAIESIESYVDCCYHSALRDIANYCKGVEYVKVNGCSMESWKYLQELNYACRRAEDDIQFFANIFSKVGSQQNITNQRQYLMTAIYNASKFAEYGF